MTRYVTVDIHGTTRLGPFGAWWAWLTPADHGEVPTGRARAWNAGAVLFLAGDLYAAHRLGVLGWILAGLAVMVAGTGFALVRVQQRIQRDGDLRRAAAWTAERQRQQPAAPAVERVEVAA